MITRDTWLVTVDSPTSSTPLSVWAKRRPSTHSKFVHHHPGHQEPDPRQPELHHLHGDVTFRPTVRDRSAAWYVAWRSSRMRSPPAAVTRGKARHSCVRRCGDRTRQGASFAGGTEAWVVRQMAEPNWVLEADVALTQRP